MIATFVSATISAMTVNAAVEMADTPAARPSRPSIKLTALVMATIQMIVIGMESQPTVLENAAPPVPASGVVRLPGIVDERALLAGSNNRDGRITVRQDAPWPFQLLLLEQDFEVEEGGEQ